MLVIRETSGPMERLVAQFFQKGNRPILRLADRNEVEVVGGARDPVGVKRESPNHSKREAVILKPTPQLFENSLELHRIRLARSSIGNGAQEEGGGVFPVLLP